MPTTDTATDDTALAQRCAGAVIDAFARYNADFRSVTRRAPERFDRRDWPGVQADVVERLDLYTQSVNSTMESLARLLGPRARDIALWREAKAHFAAGILSLPDPEFLKTFFSSITRRLCGTIGVNPESEFIALDLDPLRGVGASCDTVTFENRGSLELLVEDVLGSFKCRTPWRDFDGSVEHVLTDLYLHLQRTGEKRPVAAIELIRPVFYQMTRAYLIGRVIGEGYVLPLAIAIRNGQRGILVDAVMLREPDVSILFSFTRSYFHADLERVAEAVVFLKSIMPRKPVSELFTVLGRAKQGKTERFREIFRHLEETDDRFVIAPGEKGLVMACFTLGSFDVVFKVIRDRFPDVKNIRREEVMAKYDLVFKHDRAGRLVDAQEFKRVRVPRDRFAPEVLEELLDECGSTVQIEGDHLTIAHMYIERKMTPLNLFLREAPREQAQLAVIEYGQAIRELAYTNIFAGDLLLKNFGVTRNGRVIFYDYDELCRVTDCRFRDMPEPDSYEDEMRGEAWFYVADNDVFPETFINFLGFDPHFKQVFLEAHGDILEADWWRQLQERLTQGEVVEVLPYHSHRVRVASSL